MAGTDKAKNAKQRATGKLKEMLGKVAGNEDLRVEGEDDQSMAKLKQAGEKVKDAFKR